MLHLSCRMSDLQFSLVLLSLKSVCNKAHKGVIYNRTVTYETPFTSIIIQLLTIEALDEIWYRPESTNIDRGGAEVNIGILRSISYHVQCLNSQQLFYYIISLNKKSNNNNKILAMDYVLDSLEFLFFTWWLTWFHSVKKEWMHNLFVITTADRENLD